MKLKRISTILTVFFFALFISAQNTERKISITFSNIPLSEAITRIEKSSSFTFFYDANKIDLNQKVSVKANNLSIGQLVAEMLKNTNINFEISNSQIVLYKKENEKSKTIPTQKTTGVVTDKNDEPLIGATVKIKGTSIGTITDINGRFSIEVPAGAQLTVSYVGYTPAVIEVTGKNNLKIALSEESKYLDELVVVGYGTQKKGNITGAVVALSDKEFAERNNTFFANAIQGKTAGVQVSMPTGKPQSGFSIRVRGTTSINALSEPLYIVDGIPTSSTKDINPADIESMTILKDAASAAIYGSSGANGVVIITTKHGTIQKPTVTLTASAGTTTPHKYMDVLNAKQYRALMTEMGRTLDWESYPYDTDWQKEVFQTGIMQNYQIAVNGGNEKAKYYLSGGFINTEGIVVTNDVQRYNFKLNLDLTPTDWLRLGGTFTYSNWEDVDVPESRSSGKSGTILQMLNTPPIITVYNPDGTFTGSPFMASFENPLSSIYGTDNKYRSWYILGNVYLEVEPVKNLTAKTLLGITHQNGKYEEFLDPFKTDWGRANIGLASEYADMDNYLVSQNTLAYKLSLNDAHNFSFLGGLIISTKNTENLSVSSKHFSSSAVKTVNGGSIMVSMNSDKSAINNLSSILNMNYDFKNRYLLTVNFRADGASNFGKDNKWGYFPSFSAGWRLSEEKFMSSFQSLSDFKIRAGWGQVGNSGITAYASYGTMTPAPYIIDGTVQNGKIPATIDNQDLKWEETTQSNIGIDLAFFNFRLAFTLDAYYKKTNDLLFDYPLPRSTGYNSSVINIGSVENKGLEFSIASKNLVNQFKWNTDFNISFNKNKVLNLGGKDLLVGYIYTREEVSLIREGYPLGTFYGYVSQGVNPLNGMIMYKGADENGDVSDEDKAIIGDANPLFTSGLNNTFSYKGFDLSILLQSVYGNDIFNATRIDIEGMYNFYNQSTQVLKRWKVPGQKTDIPKAIYGSTANSLISSRFIEDGSYLRVKNITLGYSIPERILKNKNIIKEFKCYLTMENPFTFTKYTGYDPEVSMFVNNGVNAEQNGAIGIDYGTYPQPRNFIFGISLKL